ncbi:MAG: zinc ribbon domain-containing protein [Clostridiales bacterium]|nr:zinc ribbon domain-containing protein [Clostridiales bacterium]
MKCRKCGRWNPGTMPHCTYCGTPLEPDDGFYSAAAPDWQSQLQDTPKTIVLVDESGQAEDARDYRDSLANEMVDLRKRKREGEQRQRRLRADSSARGYAPSGRSVRTTSNRGTFFSATLDNPDASLRPVDPEMVENPAGVNPDARIVYSSTYRGARQQVQRTRERNPYAYGGTQRIMALGDQEENQPVYDGYHDTSEYIPEYQRTDDYENSLSMRSTKAWSPRRVGMRSVMLALLIVCSLLVGAWLVITVFMPMMNAGRNNARAEVTITPTIRDDLAAHTITIPGTDGERITIRELRKSAIVTGGVATFDIADHIWYEDYENFLQESMTVTLTPYLITEAGQQTPLATITYDIDIPLSPIELVTPDSPYKVVSTAMYTIVFYVSEGSSITVNGEDYSDLVNTEGGKVSYNATVQPIGENVFNIVVRSQYCRENSLTVTLYREKQDIPLDLSSDIYSRSSDNVMTVRATTIPGAVVNVLSPYSDLDITNTDTDGSFTFKALFDKIGDNTIIITADYPGKKQTRVEYTVYYVPSVDVYSRKAWDIVTQYNDLMDNIDLRKSKNQIYVCIGKIVSIETTKPQRAFMECATKDGSVTVYIENSSQTQWNEGQSYRLYADAYGMYSSKPWLIARYTYDPQ